MDCSSKEALTKEKKKKGSKVTKSYQWVIRFTKTVGDAHQFPILPWKLNSSTILTEPFQHRARVQLDI